VGEQEKEVGEGRMERVLEEEKKGRRVFWKWRRGEIGRR